jgi:hypothetical protein
MYTQLMKGFARLDGDARLPRLSADAAPIDAPCGLCNPDEAARCSRRCRRKRTAAALARGLQPSVFTTIIGETDNQFGSSLLPVFGVRHPTLPYALHPEVLFALAEGRALCDIITGGITIIRAGIIIIAGEPGPPFPPAAFSIRIRAVVR